MRKSEWRERAMYWREAAARRLALLNREEQKTADLERDLGLTEAARDRNAADLVEARKWAAALENKVRGAECRAVEAERERDRWAAYAVQAEGKDGGPDMSPESREAVIAHLRGQDAPITGIATSERDKDILIGSLRRKLADREGVMLKMRELFIAWRNALGAADGEVLLDRIQGIQANHQQIVESLQRQCREKDVRIQELVDRQWSGAAGPDRPRGAWGGKPMGEGDGQG